MIAPFIALALLTALHPAVQGQPPQGQPPVKEKASGPNAASKDFEKEMRVAGELYDALTKRTTALLLEGKLDEANRILVDAVPKEKRSAAHAFVLGNLLFDIDHDLAYKLHEEANAKAPGNPVIQLEWALEQHRVKKYAEAEKLYEGLVAGPDAKNPQAHALRADCLLHLSRSQAAIAAWEAADPRRRHTSIEQAASWVYGKVSPEVRRCRLVADVQAKKLDAVEPLIILDLSFDRDLWNSRTNEEYLEHDLPIAAATLGKDTNRYKELEFLARTSVRDDPDFMEKKAPADNKTGDKKTDDSKRGATALGLLGDKPRLAEKSLVASYLFRAWLEADIVSGDELLRWFERDLRARAESKTGDFEDWKLLAALYDGVDSPKLEEVDRLAWEKYGDPDFGGSLLAHEREALTSGDPVLAKMLEKHPDHPGIMTFALQCAEREKKPTADLIVKYINAEFTHMYSYRDADKGFAILKKALEGAPK